MRHIANSSIGLKKTPESIQRWKDSLARNGNRLLGRISPRKGVTLSKETREKISNGLRGKTNAQVHSIEFKISRERVLCKPVDLITKDGIIIKTFVSSAEAGRECQVHRTAVDKARSRPGYYSAKGMFFQKSNFTYDQILEMRKSNPI